jgi:hypothetical protein
MLAFIGEHIGHCRHGACIYPSLTGVSVRSRLFHPEPLTDPDLTLSRHPARATARRLATAGAKRTQRLHGVWD